MLSVTSVCQEHDVVEVKLSQPHPAHTRRPTIYDVARVAGVSHATVTRLLKGFEGIRPETRDRVTAAIAQLDYRPNLNARSLTTGRSHRIAALTHEITEVGPSRILAAATDAAREAGYFLDTVTLDARDSVNIQTTIDELTQSDLAGILGLASTDEMIRVFQTTDFTVPVWVDRDPDEFGPGSPVQPVGFWLILEHLFELGHRRVLHIAGSSSWIAARNRAREFDAAVAALGMESAGVAFGDWSARSGYEVAMGLADPFDATAIVAANDQTALGVVLALTERGVRVPADVSVTGVDDIPEAAFFLPPLTTLRVDFGGQGRGAIEQLLARISGETPPPPVLHPSELIIRRSTAPRRAGG